MKALLETARGATPYLLVELVLPGGTLIALALWLLRNKEELELQRRFRAAADWLLRRDGSVNATGSLAGKVASSA